MRICQFVDFTGGRSDRCGSEGRPFLITDAPVTHAGPRMVILCEPHEAEWRDRPAWDPLPDLPLGERDATVWEVMSR